MTPPPATPKVYHITHVANLQAIVAEGALVSDATILARGGPQQAIGMSGIKERRVKVLDVPCHPGTKVGDYVPFYFCPRSVMLYVVSRANHQELTYKGGQGPILHLEADLHAVIKWAEAQGQRWAFSLSNAGAFYTEFRNEVQALSDLDWNAIVATDFRQADVKEGKQAEFLVYGAFPFKLVERIGVASVSVREQVLTVLAGATHRPKVELLPGWYF